jgi:hypothetical protein
MDNHTATELAYKNGYEQGKKDAVRHGRWVDNHCTECGEMPMGTEEWERLDVEPPRFERFMDYCPCCGAKMRGDSHE